VPIVLCLLPFVYVASDLVKAIVGYKSQIEGEEIVLISFFAFSVSSIEIEWKTGERERKREGGSSLHDIYHFTRDEMFFSALLQSCSSM
jgi:hypothetical protein